MLRLKHPHMNAPLSMTLVRLFLPSVSLPPFPTQIAPNPNWVAKQPWAGIAGTYNPGMDPWKQGDLAQFRREFYQKTMQWLSSPGIRTYQVSDVFVWGMASWDMFGIYPDSTANGGTYRDSGLVAEIAKHNLAVVGAKVRSA